MAEHPEQNGIAADFKSFKARYRLIMVSIFFYVVLCDASFLWTTRQYTHWINAFVSSIVIFVFFNGIAIGFFFKPVGLLSGEQVQQAQAVARIVKLPMLSSLWGGFLGFIYAALASSALIIEQIQLNQPLDIPYILWTFVNMLNGYSIFIAFYLYFMVSDYAMDLRHWAWRQFGIGFPAAHTRIWHKLLFVCLVISILPLTSLLFSILLLGAAHLENIVLTGFYALFGIFVSTWLVNRSFSKPIENLKDSLGQVQQGDYTLRVPITSNDEVGDLTAHFNDMIQGLQEREFIRDTFGKYVTESVAHEILNNKIQLAGSVRLATIFFTDIESYTTISEQMEPAEVIAMLNDYFSFLVEIITRHKGVVNKFIGDSICAIFNVPLEDEHHARNAIQAALDIQALAQGRRFGPRQIPITTRIGINTGIVVAGNIGSKERLEYTVIGDEVNVASRLEQLNKTYQSHILVGEHTYILTQQDFSFEPLGSVTVKGKVKPVQVYKVSSRAKPTESPLAGTGCQPPDRLG